MFSVPDIIINERQTHVSSETGKLRPYWRWKAAVAACSLPLGWAISAIDPTIYATIIAVYGILIGFGFNILFFAIAQRYKSESTSSKEALARAQRIQRLNEHIFYRVSYFVSFSIVLIFVAFLLLFFSYVSVVDIVPSAHEWMLSIANSLNYFLKHTLYALLIFLLIDTIIALYMQLKIINFYFDFRLRHHL